LKEGVGYKEREGEQEVEVPRRFGDNDAPRRFGEIEAPSLCGDNDRRATTRVLQMRCKSLSSYP